MFDLHNIEEARHILFTKSLLKSYAAKAGYIKRTLYSYIILLNILFVRTMYVKKEIFERIGLENPDKVFKIASKNFKNSLKLCLEDITEFINSWKGLTMPPVGHGGGYWVLRFKAFYGRTLHKTKLLEFCKACRNFHKVAHSQIFYDAL